MLRDTPSSLILHWASPRHVYCTNASGGGRDGCKHMGILVASHGGCRSPAQQNSLSQTARASSCSLLQASLTHATSTWATQASQLAPSRAQGDPRGLASLSPTCQHLLPAQAMRLLHVLLPFGGIHPLLLPGKGWMLRSQGFLKKQQKRVELKCPKTRIC